MARTVVPEFPDYALLSHIQIPDKRRPLKRYTSPPTSRYQVVH